MSNKLREPAVNGKTVTIVDFRAVTGAATGRYRQTGVKTWEELDSRGRVAFTFVETNRDDWSVYLRDESRQANCQIDLHRKRISYVFGGNQRFDDLFAVSTSSAKINGWMVNQVSFGTEHGHRLGTFRQTGPSTWVEFDKGGDRNYSFEELQRDDWSVYLYDSDRDVKIQLDLHRKQVGYAVGTGPTTDLYHIGMVRAFQENAYLEPALSGATVNWLTFKNSDDISTGIYCQTGPYSWVEEDSAGRARFYFVETARHNGTVFLLDVSRRVTLGLHIQSHIITYSDPKTHEYELYRITQMRSKISGWVANRVSVRNAEGKPLGEFRQTGQKTWAELDPQQYVVFRFIETQRDEWSVYLRDPSRNVSLQLDLHTQWVSYRGGARLYPIESASANPTNHDVRTVIPTRGQNVRTVYFGSMNGAPMGAYHQVGESTWVEVDPAQNKRATLREIRRDQHSVYLHNDANGESLQLDLLTQRILITTAASPQARFTVLRATATMNGWLASEVVYGNPPDRKLGTYRMVDDNAWALFDRNEQVTAHFKEVRREDWSIFLQNATTQEMVELNLRTQNVFAGPGQATNNWQGRILSEAIESGQWIHSERITSRSALTEDFAPRGGSRNPTPVYRTSVSFSPMTSWVEIWASRQVTVEIEHKTYTIDPVKPAKVSPSVLAKLSISIPATDLDCPTLTLRTDLMMPEHRHYIYPDVEAHKKLVGLKPGAIHAAREDLGISDHYSEADLHHFQTALQNVAKAKQYTYNKRPHGVHHDRVLHPQNMDHPHFVLDFAGGKTRYQPIAAHEVAFHTAGAELITPELAQSFFGDIGNFFKKATKIVIHTVKKVAVDVEHTVEDVAKDVVDTVEHVAKDAVKTVHDVGEDLVHGDILKAGEDLLQGGEHMGSDLTKGALHTIGDAAGGIAKVVGDEVEGAGQMLVLTVHTAEKAVKYVLDHTGFLGEAVKWLFHKVGAAVKDVVGWLLDKLGWDDILNTHDALVELFNRRIDLFATFPGKLKAEADNFFGHLVDQISDEVDEAVDLFVPHQVGPQPSPVASHSAAVEKIEWLLGKITHYASEATPLDTSFNQAAEPSTLNDIVGLIEQKIGRDGEKVTGAIDQALGDVSHLFTDANPDPSYLIGAVFELVKAAAIISLDAVSVVLDAVLDLMEAALKGLRQSVNASFDIPFVSDLYSTLTDDSEMTFLNVMALLLAIPMTIVSKAEFGVPPFESGAIAAANLNEMPKASRDLAELYYFSHFILSLISVPNDIVNGINARKAAKAKKAKAQRGPVDDNEIELRDPSADQPVEPHPDSRNHKIQDNVFQGIMLTADFAFNFMALIAGTPAPIDEPYIIPWTNAKDDVFEAPSYFGHVAYWFLLSGFLANLLLNGAGVVSEIGGAEKLAKGAGNVQGAFNCAFGLVLMGLMSTIDWYDRTKMNALNGVFSKHGHLEGKDLFDKLEAHSKALNDVTTSYWKVEGNNLRAGNTTISIDDWVKAVKNYRNWSTAGIRRKGFSNVMDSFPPIGQLGAMPYIAEASEGLSLIGTGAFDFVGHLAEAITYMDRTKRNELL